MIYADTSALRKPYQPEPFSTEFDALIQENTLTISRLSIVECRCTLVRRRRRAGGQRRQGARRHRFY